MLKIYKQRQNYIFRSAQTEELAFHGQFVIYLDENLNLKLTKAKARRSIVAKVAITSTDNGIIIDNFLKILETRIPKKINAGLYCITRATGPIHASYYLYFMDIKDEKCLLNNLKKLKAIGYLK